MAVRVTSRPGADHFPGPLHYRSTILSALGPYYALTVLFLGTHTRTSRWVTHPGIALARYSLNFGVPMEPEASELPKGLVLGRDGNIHIRITPLGDVGSHNPPPLRGPTSSSAHFRPGIGSDTKLSHPDPGSTTSRARSTTVTQYCPLWAPTTPSRFCFWELTRELPGGSPILGLLSCATRLTSEFLRNPKPVSSQKALC